MICMPEVKELNFKHQTRMSKENKILILQFVCFALLFLIGKLILSFTEITGILNAILSAVFAALLSPQFKVFKTKDGEKVYMRWMFSKKAKELNW